MTTWSEGKDVFHRPGVIDVVNAFKGKFSFLSNFYPVWIELDGVLYPTVEHAYQAAKTLDNLERARVLLAYDAAGAKRIGRTVTMRAGWDGLKVEVMRRLLRQKFSNSDLREKLLGTGDDLLVEGNNWGDVFWGVCGSQGRNMLGQLLMEIRLGFRQEEEKVRLLGSAPSKSE